jgi:hypothetical protein
MTDMRDFKPVNETNAQIAFVDSDAIGTKDAYVLEDSGGLGEFHRNMDNLEEEGSGRGKMIGALVVALMLGAAGAYAYSMWTPHPNDVVADKDLPQTAALTPPPPVAPVADKMAAAPTDTAASQPGTAQSAMTAPTAPDVVKPAPVTKEARVANAPRVTRAPVPAETPAPSPATVAPPREQAAAVPEPVSPTPPAAAVAGNPPLNEQSAAPVETPAPAAPAAPAEATAPAPAEPAPAQ